MLKRKCPCCKERVISLWNIAYNLHIESKQRICSKCNCKYEISKKWDALRRVLWILLIPLYLLPYFIFNDIINNLLVPPNGNYLLVLYNAIVYLSPILMMELIILSIFPLKFWR